VGGHGGWGWGRVGGRSVVGCAPAGMRRVDRVVIEIDRQGRLRRTAQGVGHRLPCRRVISRQLAEWLRAQGVPVVVRGGAPRVP
jgi:hypothetical protein